jgi:molybdopterin-synthase adenylyltransferase
MSRVVISAELFEKLRKTLFIDENESSAVLIAKAVHSERGIARLVVREIVEPGPHEVVNRSPVSIELSSEFVARLSQRSRKTGESLIFVHNHPFPLNYFSSVDDAGEKVLADFFKRRTPNVTHGAMLLTPEVTIARLLGTDEYLNVLSIGPNITSNSTLEKSFDDLYDRQIRAFGKNGQKILGLLRVGIVGLGGTGSVVCQQLAHLGIENFMLIDPDTLERSNLNRVVGASPDDVGMLKVDIARRLINQIKPSAVVTVIADSVLKNRIARQLVDVDFIFACTDSHGSRAIINQLAYQYFVPGIDMGVVITTEDNRIQNVAARTQMLVPGLACMVCGNLLDYKEVRRDLMTDFERKQDPYITNVVEPAPAVISVNSVIASLATTMFLNAVVGIPGKARLINYNAISGTTRSATISQHPMCVVCSANGALAKVDEWPLPGREN